MEDHDRKLALLLEKCKGLHSEIENSPELHELYRRVTTQECLSEIGATLTDLFGAYPESDHLALLAQHVVNNTNDLPGYYSTARLWNKYKGEFMAVVSRSSMKGHHQATIKAGEEVLRSVNRLLGVLKEKRQQLSLEYDVPYVSGSRITAG
ncbi:MAG: hypothetical protein HY726_14030 [Candidatus Rokubacteria bacterium]|nr:hypothetical protein [Candidatus Rokubacteria bacterium]